MEADLEEGRGRGEGEHPGYEDHRAPVAAIGPRPRSTASFFHGNRLADEWAKKGAKAHPMNFHVRDRI
eukprot:3443870-Pyramimonas_sp.AAC.1